MGWNTSAAVARIVEQIDSSRSHSPGVVWVDSADVADAIKVAREEMDINYPKPGVYTHSDEKFPNADKRVALDFR